MNIRFFLNFVLLLFSATAWASDCKTPDVACADTVTVALDNQQRLWRAFVNDEHIYLQRQQNNGDFTDPIKVNTEGEVIANKGEDRPQIAFAGDDQIHVSWTTPMSTDYSGQIRYSYSHDSGKNFSNPETLHTDEHDTSHRFSVLKTNGKGDVFVAWIDKRDHFSEGVADQHPRWASVYYNWSSDGGKTFQTEDIRLQRQTCECCRIAMDFDDKQRPIVLLRDIYPNSERDHSLIRFSSNSEPQKAIRATHGKWQLDGCPHQGAALLKQGDTEHLFWFDRDQSFYRNVSGDKFSTSEPVGDKGSEHGDLAYADGVLYRVWQRYADDAMHIELQRSTDEGENWDKTQRLASTQGSSDYPFLVSQQGKVLLSWHTQEEGHVLLDVSENEANKPTASDKPRPQTTLNFKGLTKDNVNKLGAAHQQQRHVIIFWSTTCAPCRQELKELAEDKEAQKLPIVLVNTADETEDKAQAFIEHLDLAHLEHWRFDDAIPARLRSEIHDSWYGELPFQLLVSPDGSNKTHRGKTDIHSISQWLTTSS